MLLCYIYNFIINIYLLKFILFYKRNIYNNEGEFKSKLEL